LIVTSALATGPETVEVLLPPVIARTPGRLRLGPVTVPSAANGVLVAVADSCAPEAGELGGGAGAPGAAKGSCSTCWVFWLSALIGSGNLNGDGLPEESPALALITAPTRPKSAAPAVAWAVPPATCAVVMPSVVSTPGTPR
jgi:hypothetical protein